MLAVMAVQDVQVLVQLLVRILVVPLVLADAPNQLKDAQRHVVGIVEQVVVDYVKPLALQSVLVVQDIA